MGAGVDSLADSPDLLTVSQYLALAHWVLEFDDLADSFRAS